MKWSLLLVITSIGCSTGVVVSVSMSPDQTPETASAIAMSRLYATIGLDGAPARETVDYPGTQRQFGLILDKKEQGLLSVDITAKDAQGGVIALGRGEVNVAGEDLVTMGVELIPPRCEGDGWCMQNPLPESNQLLGIWGTAPNDIWAFGDYYTIFHFDGTTWGPRDTGLAGCDIRAVWGNGPDDVWLAKPGCQSDIGIFHWDGNSWTPSAMGSFFGIWGDGPNNVWAVGAGGKIIHLTDQTKGWEMVTSPATGDLSGVWGSGTGQVWAVGDGGAIVRCTGTSCMSLNGPTNSPLAAVWGSGPDDIWAVGDGTILHSTDGSNWTDYREAFSSYSLSAIWGTGPHDIWAAGVADKGTILHYDGSNWLPVNADEADQAVRGVWGSGPDEVWAVTLGGKILRRNRSSWITSLPSAATTTRNLRALWGSGRNDVWALGEKGTMLHWNGASWTSVPSGTTADLLGAGTDGIPWAVGESGTILHMENGTWQPRPIAGVTQDLLGVGGSKDDVWIVGRNGTILHREKDQWQPLPGQATKDLYAVWGSGPGDVWVVGDDTILHFDGTSWTSRAVPMGINTSFRAVWGALPSDVWIGGMDPQFLHWDGNTLSSPMGAAPYGPNYAIWGPASGGFWAAGEGINRYDRNDPDYVHNMGWSHHWTPSDRWLYAIWGTPDGELWAAGDNGTIIHHPK